MSSEEIKSIFGQRVRVRVMGLYRRQDQLLLLRHRGLNEANELWLPPGGGVEFGEGLEEALIREFNEEIGVEAKVGEFLFFSEFKSGELHAIELFFSVDTVEGDLQLGFDPEMEGGQVIDQYKLMGIEEIKKLPKGCFHPVFQNLRNLDELFRYQGFFNFRNNV
ncbi:NUDIX domain-containing protein [Reichenbachiella ulvae]|uniref:NUDIX domain-containing protein n=1 Tax=Reichenbachiella ulvae TaxID=2980104 RepID=A0ABT3CQH6_9BACT|nr:NUDIX domain-containing protein [Reichenbachiella ulvae]MCV9385877.1 NUDIX domain-containing protein [Reichenbachiella ulvae]